MIWVVRLTVGFILSVLCSLAMATLNQGPVMALGHRPSGTEPLIFQDWKNQQIREAQEALAKVTGSKKSRAFNQKATKVPVATELPSSQRIHVSSTRGARYLKPGREVRSASESLQYAYDLGLEEYITVYLVNFRRDAQALISLVKRLNTQESAQLMQTLMKEWERRATTERVGTTVSPSHLSDKGGPKNAAKQ